MARNEGGHGAPSSARLGLVGLLTIVTVVVITGVAAIRGGRLQAVQAASAVGGVQAGGTRGLAWLVRSIERPTDHREIRPDVLDTPMLPGSVMKALTLVAALEHHVIEPDTARICRRSITVDGRRYTCSHPDLKRPLTPAEALAHSCNDFFGSLAPRLSREHVNDVRARVGLPPIQETAHFPDALVGLDGPRITPRALLDVFTRLIGADRTRPVKLAEATRRTLLAGLRGAASYGSASEFATRRIPALAKTGTAPMPGGGALGIVVAFTPADRPQRAALVVAPGAAGRDATSIAADLLDERDERVRVGRTDVSGTTHVDTLQLEEYVARVVAAEGEPAAPDAAQQALAIAARTFALANRDRHRGEGYDLCDTTHCQVTRAPTSSATRAARATAGRVLLYRGQPAAVFYSASCGGHSTLASDVWPGAIDEPFQPGRRDDACADEPAWTSEVAASDIERALRSAGRQGNRLRDLRIVQRNSSGRVARMRAEGFVPAEISGQDFRMALGRVAGWQHLKSTLFDLRRTSTGYSFAGRGSGHGVGMCVIGAGRRAAKAATASEILQFYYPGLRVQAYRSSGLAPARSEDAAASSAGSPLPPGSDVLLALPGAEEGERALVSTLVRRARDEIAARLNVAVPSVIRVTVHPTTESFSRATGQPWWIAGATDGVAMALLPVETLRRQGQLERTIRHEVAHVLLDEPLRARPMWVREGAARYFAALGREDEQRSESSPRVSCPTDAELRRPASVAALRDAYARSEGCFRREIGKGRSWRDIR